MTLAGGVSANTALRNAFKAMEEKGIWKIYIPKFSYTTDNAAMIAMCGHYKYLDGEFCPLGKPAFSRTGALTAITASPKKHHIIPRPWT